MTDWLDDILDQDPGATPAENFTAKVLDAALAEEHAHSPWPRRFGLATAAALLLSVGFWLGHGVQPLHQEPVLSSGANHAALDLEEIYQNRDVLEVLDVLSDEELEQAFLDAENGTWVLDYALEVPR